MARISQTEREGTFGDALLLLSAAAVVTAVKSVFTQQGDVLETVAAVPPYEPNQPPPPPHDPNPLELGHVLLREYTSGDRKRGR